MHSIIEKILNEYVLAKQEQFTGHAMGSFFRNDIPMKIYQTGVVDSNKYLITGSVGQGNWATVPWVCIFDRSITTSATKGVYIVYLLAKDGKTLYLTFNQGCTDIRRSHSKRETIEIMREKAADIVSKINGKGFSTDENINLGNGLTELAELYQKGTIFYKAYQKGNVPSSESLLEDLKNMMAIYSEFASLKEEKVSVIDDSVERFKKLLEIFVRQLKINNDILPGEKVYGQGYRDMPKIQRIYEDVRVYKGFILELALQAGFHAFDSSNYIHLRDSWVNIVPVFKKRPDGKHDVVALQVVNKPDNKSITNYPHKTVEALGLFDEKEENEELKNFFNDFKNEITKFQSLRMRLGHFDSWEIVDENTAIKTCDKSFFAYNGSGVPKEICWFFDAENIPTGTNKAVKLIFNGQEYAGKLSNDTTDRRRIQIRWSGDLAKGLEEYQANNAKAVFVKLAESVYEITMKGGEEKMTVKAQVEKINEYIAAKGFNYDGQLIENFYLSLQAKPFVILAGTSGTGKTRLVRLFAEAIQAQYKLVSVRPDWSDSSDLFGHVDLNQKFIPGAIIDFVKQAELNPTKPYFLCLDEMNLARVEYYMSDILSAIETRRYESGRIVTDPVIPSSNYGNDSSAAGRYGKVILPGNLYIVGTVNMDETTFLFSKKVLDRANTIEFSYVDLLSMPTFSTHSAEQISVQNDFLVSKYITLNDCDAKDAEYISSVCTTLQRINSVLEKANAHVGYRVRDEIVFYMLNNRESGLLEETVAFDNQIMQKILPRIQGSSEAIKAMLEELLKVCASEKYTASEKKINFMIKRYEEDGFTSYWL